MKLFEANFSKISLKLMNLLNKLLIFILLQQFPFHFNSHKIQFIVFKL